MIKPCYCNDCRLDTYVCTQYLSGVHVWYRSHIETWTWFHTFIQISIILLRKGPIDNKPHSFDLWLGATDKISVEPMMNKICKAKSRQLTIVFLMILNYWNVKRFVIFSNGSTGNIDIFVYSYVVSLYQNMMFTVYNTWYTSKLFKVLTVFWWYVSPIHDVRHNHCQWIIRI